VLVAVTRKLAICPKTHDWFVGCLVMAGSQKQSARDARMKSDRKKWVVVFIAFVEFVCVAR